MDKRFRNLILAQVESVVHDKPPSRTSLYELLKIATPELKIHAVDNTSQRESAYRALKVLIHPDKHAKALKNDRKELSRVTKIFQETTAYYNVCCSRLGVESPGMSSNNSFGNDYGAGNDAAGYAETVDGRDYGGAGLGRRGGGYNDYDNDTYQTPRKGGERERYNPHTRHGWFDQSNISNKRDFRPPSIISTPPSSFRNSGRIPVEFDAYEHWPYMDAMVKGPTSLDNGGVTSCELAWIMACRVINLRGAVIHGQPIGRAYQVSKKSNELDKYHTVDEVLRHFGFVCRSQLRRVDDIKAEILEHGPVVSVSFQLHKSFYQSTQHAAKFSAKQVSKRHPLLIVGWTMTSAGELWKVQALTGDTFEIGTGQFEISTTVLAPPEHILESIPWQSGGPYLDLNMPSVMGLSKDWRELRHMSISISAKELEALVSTLDGGFQKAIQQKQSFVIRDKTKKAYSRRYTLREVTTADKGKWKISVSQAENSNSD